MENREDRINNLQTRIYNKYLECLDNPDADTIILICELVDKWCRKYKFKKPIMDFTGNYSYYGSDEKVYIQADDLGIDICKVFDDWINVKKKTFKNQSEFFGYLWLYLKNRLIENYRVCPPGLRLSKGILEIHNMFEKIKTKMENNLERKLKYEECEELFLEIMTGKNMKINYREYEEIIYLKNIKTFSQLPVSEDTDINGITQDPKATDPVDDCIKSEQISIMREAIGEILKNENNQCLNDILTVKFIDYPVFLDCLSEFKNEKIIQNYKKTKVTPFLKDIYLEYNDVQPQSAGPSAKRLFNDFEKKLREKVRNLYKNC